MTFEQAFLKVKEKFNNADASNSSDFAIQITMTDEDCGGTFYAEVKNGTLAVEPYDYYDNNLVLDITKSALLAVLSGRSSLDKAIANGDAAVKGDASKLADLKATIKKAPAKKAATKKAPAKKEAAPKKETPAKKEAVKKETAPKAEVKAAPAKKEAPKAAAPAKKEAPKAETKTTTAKTTTKKTTK